MSTTAKMMPTRNDPMAPSRIVTIKPMFCLPGMTSRASTLHYVAPVDEKDE